MFTEILASSDEVVSILNKECGVGPFGGGSLMVATAIMRIFGKGEICGLFDKDGGLHHAVTKIDDLYVDMSGAHKEKEIRDLWLNEAEIALGEIRPADSGEFMLHGCGSYFPNVVNKLIEAMTKAQAEEGVR